MVDMTPCENQEFVFANNFDGIFEQSVNFVIFLGFYRNYLTVDVDEVFLPQSIYIALALYKLFVKFELKLLKKSIVLTLSLRSVSVFVLLDLNTTEANPIKYPKAKKKHCSVFSAEWHIDESFGETPHDREAASYEHVLF